MISISMFEQNQITLNTVIKAEFLYQLMYFKFIGYKLKFIDVITITLSYLYHMIKAIILHITTQLK